MRVAPGADGVAIGDNARMRYVEVAPSPRVAWLVERFWMLEGVASGPPDVIIPDGRVEIVFHYAGTFSRHIGAAEDARIVRQPAAMVVGQMLAPVRLAPEGRIGVAAIRLRPAATRALLGFSLTDISERFVDLEQVFPSAAPLRERLAGETSDAARIGLLEAWLIERLSGARPGGLDLLDARVAAAVDAIVQSGGRASIDALADLTSLHVRQLERRFLHDVGLAPKTFARICRLQMALGSIRGGMTLTDAALHCGFYDQAHMARDLRLLAAMSPRAWQQHAGELAPLFIARTEPIDTESRSRAPRR